MIRLSWSTFLDRWQVFIGSILTVSLGVALSQSSLLALASATSPTIPPGLSAAEETSLREALQASVDLLGITVGISVFVAFFVVGSTFSFTVAQRSRDFALLRLVGASPLQVARLLLGEALLIGAIGTLLGVLFGIPFSRLVVYVLTQMGLVPEGFNPEFRSWILLVSAGIGVGVAVVASLGASRRASRVRPLEALRDTDQADKVMSLSRWIIGLVALAAAVALLAFAPTIEGAPLSASVLSAVVPGLVLLIISLSALTPLVVPLIGGLIGLLIGPFLRGDPINELGRANLRDGVRRSASTAAPIVILVGLVVGFSGAISVVTAGTQEATRSLFNGDVIVTTSEPIGEQIGALDGVRTVSEVVWLEVGVESPETSAYDDVEAIAIDPITYSKTRRLKGITGDLNGLRGDTVALDELYASDLQIDVGDVIGVRLDGMQKDVRVIATFRYRLQGPEVMLPLGLVPAGDYQRRYVVQIDSTETSTGISERINGIPSSPSSGSDGSSVSAMVLDDWVIQEVESQQETAQKIILAVMGSVTIYLVIAVINAVIISSSARKVEFAITRLTGLTQRQVVKMALWESLTVVIAGVMVGALAAAGAIVGATAAVSGIVGTRVVATPWVLFGLVTVGVAVIVGFTSVLTTRAATRDPAIAIAAARE